MSLLRKTWIATLCFVVLLEVSKANQYEEETYETESEVRVPRDIKVTFPGSDRIPKPPTALCFREPCNVPGGFRSPARPRFRRSNEVQEEEKYQSQSEVRVPRDIKVTFPGSDRIPKPPTALCFREPCNVPGGFRPPARPRFRRSDEALEEEIFETQPEVRLPREIKVTFPGSDRIPKPPIALCFRQPCNLPGGFRPAARPSRFRRSEDNEEIATDEPKMESHRVARDITVSFPGSNRIPKPSTALCFRQPCNVPGSYRPPLRPMPRFRRSATDKEEAYELEPQRVEREIRRTYSGRDRLTETPLVLCNREPCNVPERLKTPTSRVL